MLLCPPWKTKPISQLMLLGWSHFQLQILFTKALGRTTNGYTADDSLCWGTVGSPVPMQPARTLGISSLSCRSKQITRFWWNSVFPFCLRKSFMVFLWPSSSPGLPIHGRVLSLLKLRSAPTHRLLFIFSSHLRLLGIKFPWRERKA